jgi:acetyltransferase-like isoleucine patch superfamily enzyme
MSAGFIHLGIGSYGRPAVKRYNEAHLRIGKYSTMADEVQILLGGEHPTDTTTTYPFHLSYPSQAAANWDSSSDMVIGSDVSFGRQ